MYKKILEIWGTFYGCIFEEDDVIVYPHNPKSEIWFRVDKNQLKHKQVISDRLNLIQNLGFIKSGEYEKEHPISIVNILFDHLIISKDKDRAIRVMKKVHHYATSFYTIDSVVLNDVKYYIVHD